MGASITWGTGSSEGNGYRKYIRDLLTQNGNQVNMVGANHSGTMQDNESSSTEGLLVDQVHAVANVVVPKFKPNVVLINAGTNDCIRNNDIPNIGDRVLLLLNDIYKTSPKATIILSTLLVYTKDPEANKRITDYNVQINSLVKRFQAAGWPIILADMQEKDKGPVKGDFIGDEIHPTDVGYMKMANIWYAALQDASNAGYLKTPEIVAGLPDDGLAQ